MSYILPYMPILPHFPLHITVGSAAELKLFSLASSLSLSFRIEINIAQNEWSEQKKSFLELFLVEYKSVQFWINISLGARKRRFHALKLHIISFYLSIINLIFYGWYQSVWISLIRWSVDKTNVKCKGKLLLKIIYDIINPFYASLV